MYAYLSRGDSHCNLLNMREIALMCCTGLPKWRRTDLQTSRQPNCQENISSCPMNAFIRCWRVCVLGNKYVCVYGGLHLWSLQALKRQGASALVWSVGSGPVSTEAPIIATRYNMSVVGVADGGKLRQNALSALVGSVKSLCSIPDFTLGLC